MTKKILTPYQKRYGNPGIETPNCPTNDFIQTLLGRKTIRRYSNQKLPPGQLDLLIACAQSAPTSSMGQSWSVIALETQTEKDEFKKLAGWPLSFSDPNNVLAYDECAVFLIFIADNYKIERSIEMLGNGEVPESVPFTPIKIPGTTTVNGPHPDRPNQLFDVDGHVAWLDQTYYSVRAIMDATIAAQTVVMCAESLGLGTMYMGSIAHCEPVSFEYLNLPKRTYPIFGLCVGYPPTVPTDSLGNIPADPNYSAWIEKVAVSLVKPRHPKEIVLHRGKYNRQVEPWLKLYNTISINWGRDVNRLTDWFGTKCVLRIKKVIDQLQRMRDLGNPWK
jgi:nitroreductase